MAKLKLCGVAPPRRFTCGFNPLPQALTTRFGNFSSNCFGNRERRLACATRHVEHTLPFLNSSALDQSLRQRRKHLVNCVAVFGPVPRGLPPHVEYVISHRSELCLKSQRSLLKKSVPRFCRKSRIG